MVLKRKQTAYLIWFFLSGLGAHRFYVGKKKSGFAIFVFLGLSILLEILILELNPSLSVDFQDKLYWSLTIPFWLFLFRDAFCISGWIDAYNFQVFEENELRKFDD